MTMNLQRSLVTLSLLFVNMEKSTSTEIVLKKNHPNAPLALIKKHNSLLLELAKPHYYKEDMDAYFYDDSNEDFLTACPAEDEGNQLEIEKEWKKSNFLLDEGERKLFFIKEYTGPMMECKFIAKPSVKKEEKCDDDGNVLYCGKSNAEIYQVGYPVKHSYSDVQFIFIYEVCHSMYMSRNRGTLYGIHRIDVPSLMLLKLDDGGGSQIKNSFQSFLDYDPYYVNNFYKGYHVYQFARIYDMATTLWELTTLFPFNYTRITFNPDLFAGMLEVDDYIRLFSKQTNEPLNFYTGTFETTKTVNRMPFSCTNLCVKEITIESFWKIILNKRNEAIVIVTQHTLISCSETDMKLCPDGHTMVKKYKKGGCIYMCPVSNGMSALMGLPELRITGSLTFTIPESKDETSFSIRGNNSITDFVGRQDGGFLEALKTVNPELATTLKPISTANLRFR